MDALETQSPTPPRPATGNTPATAARAFSITELLVVIGIIVLLAALLMVAMGKVRESSLRTTTLSTMQNFGRAADSFQMEHGFYPGVIPEHILAEAVAKGNVKAKGVGNVSFSSTENALLHMMGGFRVCPPGTPGCDTLAKGHSPIVDDYAKFLGNLPDFPSGIEFEIGESGSVWRLAVNLNLIGEGPVINNKPYAPYYTPGPNEVRPVPGQGPENLTDPGLPDLVDAWGMPILYTRRIRSAGPLVGEPNPAKSAERPQFVMEGMHAYLHSKSLGERGLDQTSTSNGSILFDTDAEAVRRRFAQIIRHPSFGKWEIEPLDQENLGRVAPRGEYVLISAGANNVFFSRNDGPGSSGTPIGPEHPDKDIVPPAGENANPRAIESFKDIVIFGGG